MGDRLYSDTGPFTIIPEWLIDSEISDGAVRLYGILGRYSNEDDAAWPSRALLAKRTRTTTKSVDRRIAELVQVGALVVEHRKADSPSGNKYNRSNIYWLKRLDPQGVGTQLSLGGDADVPTVGTLVSLGRDTAVAQNESHEREPKERDTREAKPMAAILADRLADRVASDGTPRPKVTTRWVLEMDRMLRIDKRDPAEVADVVDWVTDHDFWSANILSPTKLRKHYDRLQKQRRREPKSRNTTLLAAFDE